MRSVTKQAVKEARLKEIKQELLNSEKLKVSCGYPDAAEDLRKRFGIGFHLVLYFVLQTYFEDNPRDLQLLRHDKDLHPAVVKPHLKNVPEYLGEQRARSHTETVNQRSFMTNLKFRLTSLVPESLKGVIHPMSRRGRRKRKEKSKPEGVSKPTFKVSV